MIRENMKVGERFDDFGHIYEVTKVNGDGTYESRFVGNEDNLSTVTPEDVIPEDFVAPVEEVDTIDKELPFVPVSAPEKAPTPKKASTRKPATKKKTTKK